MNFFRKILNVFLLSALLAANALAAFVNSAAGYSGTSSTTVTTAAASHTTGNLLVVKLTAQEFAFSGGTITITDTAGNTWNSCTILSNGSHGFAAQVFYAYNITGNASNVITATFSVAQRYKGLVVEQYSGMDTTSAVLIAQSAVSADGTTVVTTGNLVTTTDSVLTAVATSSNDRSWTPDTGFTESYDIITATGASSGGFQYKAQTGGGTYTISATASSSSNLGIAGAAFMVTGGGGGSSGLLRKRRGN